MSKNAKNARRHAEARARNRTKGYKGPKSTKCTNSKPKAWFRMKDVHGRLLCLTNNETKAAAPKGKKRRSKSEDE